MQGEDTSAAPVNAITLPCSIEKTKINSPASISIGINIGLYSTTLNFGVLPLVEVVQVTR